MAVRVASVLASLWGASPFSFLPSGLFTLALVLALPLLRKGWREDLTEPEARKLLEDSMRVLFYRDTRASAKITIGKVDAGGSAVSDPILLETFWEHPEFVRGGGHLGDGSW